MEQQTFWIDYLGKLGLYLKVRNYLRNNDINKGVENGFIWCNATEEQMKGLKEVMPDVIICNQDGEKMFKDDYFFAIASK